jgi:hypothetical protein
MGLSPSAPCLLKLGGHIAPGAGTNGHVVPDLEGVDVEHFGGDDAPPDVRAHPTVGEHIIPESAAECAGQGTIHDFCHVLPRFPWSYPQVARQLTDYKILDQSLVAVGKRDFVNLASQMHNTLTAQV